MNIPCLAKVNSTLKPLASAVHVANLNRVAVSASLAVSLLAGYAQAQTAADTELEIITVTAEKRQGNVMEIASSISAKSATFLEDAEIFDVIELSQHIPNLHIFGWGGRRDTNIFIRGIGPGLFTDPTVGFYVDGINYSNNGSFDLELMDIQHIEVLRGPQGTLYGGNSLAGIINIVTQPPSDETEGKLALTFDDLSQTKLSASVSTPVSDALFFSTAVSVTQSDGYLDNIYNKQDFGQRDDVAARAKLRWLATDDLEATLSLSYEKFEGDSYAMGPYDSVIAKPQQVDHDFIGDDDRDAIGVGLNVKWQGDAVEFTSITSWQDWENFNSADQDAGSMQGLVFHSRSNEEHDQISQEFRWNNKESDKLNWIFGLYAFQTDFIVATRNSQDFSAFGMGGPSETLSRFERDDNGYAAFGQIDYELSKQLTLTAGLRFDHQDRAVDIDLAPDSVDPSTKLQGQLDFDQLLPKLALSYTTDSDALLYASISEGYRAGGFDTLYPNLEKPNYDSETSINYELGYKTRLLDDDLELSAAAFLIDIDDQQVQQLSSETFTIVTENAGVSQSKGFEFESRYIPADNWLLSFSANYTKAEFDKYRGVNVVTFEVEDYSGNALPNTPEWSANISIQHILPLGSVAGFHNLDWFTQVDSQLVDDYFFDAPNQLEQESYHLLNVKTGVEADNWQAYLWVKNALDEYYSKVEFNFGFGRTVEAAKPRSIGVTLRYQF